MNCSRKSWPKAAAIRRFSAFTLGLIHGIFNPWRNRPHSRRNSASPSTSRRSCKRRHGWGWVRELQILAVQRGCRHYSNGTEPAEPLADEEQFPNQELAIALLSPSLPYDPHSIRCGAAMLGASENDPKNLARLALFEHATIPVRYVAECGERFEPENPFWRELLSLLPPAPAPNGVLPHPTRFVAMTGFTRKGPGLVVEWQRPQELTKQ